MILLWGISQDRPLALMRDALARRGAAVFFLDQMQAARTRISLDVGAAVEGEIQVAEDTCRLDAISAAYVRCYVSRELPFAEPPERIDDARRHAVALDDILVTWLGVTPARVVNPLAAMASNSSKPYQLALIGKAGFAMPDTLLSTDANAVKEFWEQHGEIIYKSVSGVRSIVSRLKLADMSRLEDIRWCPTQFQQYIPGRDYRVHVVAGEVFACEIVSDADDYRYGGRQGLDVELRPFELPSDCADKCRALAASLDLVVAGIDLRRTPNGEWVCFEVNPSPAFSYYQAATDQPIADAIAAVLAAGTPSI